METLGLIPSSFLSRVARLSESSNRMTATFEFQKSKEHFFSVSIPLDSWHRHDLRPVLSPAHGLHPQTLSPGQCFSSPREE